MSLQVTLISSAGTILPVSEALDKTYFFPFSPLFSFASSQSATRRRVKLPPQPIRSTPSASKKGDEDPVQDRLRLLRSRPDGHGQQTVQRPSPVQPAHWKQIEAAQRQIQPGEEGPALCPAAQPGRRQVGRRARQRRCQLPG